MPPPQLARDAPRTNVLHPIEVHPPVVARDDPHPLLEDRGDRRLGELLHAHEPLQRDQRLDALPGAVRVGDLVLVGLLAHDAAFRPQRRHHRRARLHHREPREALARLGGHAPVLTDHRDLVEFVALADLEVVGVVRGGDLQLAGAEVHLHVLVRDDRQMPSDERQDRGATDELAVALVLGVDRHRGVPQHRLRAHRRDRHGAPVLEVVADRVQVSVSRALLDLQVGDRRVAAGIPVDDVAIAVDQALLVERHEHLHHRAVVALVQGEALVAVVARGPQPLELLDDRVAVVLAPLPHAPLERLAPELLAAACPRRAAPSRPAPASRSRRDRCRGSTSCAGRASGDSGSACPESSR